MCSEYQTKVSVDDIQASLDRRLINQATFDWGSAVKLHTQAPVILKEDGKLQIALKSFPSAPLPNARLSGLEGQTDGKEKDDNENEHRQIKRIYDMNRWKDGFIHHPVLAPMSGFLEFAYWGKHIGTAQEFKVPNQKVFFVAGLSFKPFTPAGPANSAMSLITHTATEQMLETHQRLVVILEGEKAAGYLDDMSAEERFSYLIENRYTGELVESKFRNMAKGWEKRVSAQEAKLHRELQYREALEKEGVEG